MDYRVTDSCIYINDLRLYAYHGVLPQERRVGGEFLVTLRVHYNITRALETDNVDDTVNYAELCHLIEREMVLPSQLLEHVAGRIAHTVFHAYPKTTAVDIKLTKINPPMGANCAGAGVELHLINDKTK
ncbi:MAG: dihydroneopterin aldolase [Prevotella sp.]|nr:dihydroneopterin aldolase [Prevotella sp.]